MGYTQPGGMHKGSDILSSRNQFSYLFSCDILLGGADQKRRAWNQSTNLVLLLISYTNRQRLAEGISRSFPITMSLYSTNPSNHLLSLVQWPAMLCRRLYRSERKKKDPTQSKKKKKKSS
jgi:hypothetical protein